MSEPIVKIVRVGASPKELDKGAKEVQEVLSLGFEMPHPPVSHEKYLMYTLIHPRVQERINFQTAYPSVKQLGYIRWAYNITETKADSFKISKQECSDLITYHKDELGGKQTKEKFLTEKLGEIRGGVPATVQKPDKDVPVDFDDYNDDLPF
jgi:hypothetical protein